MAQTKRRKKQNHPVIEESLRLRIIFSLILFFIVVAALQLGAIGRLFHHLGLLLCGHIIWCVYVLLLIIAGYVLYKAKLPRFEGPEAIGVYLMLTSLLIFWTASSSLQDKGFALFPIYFDNAMLFKGGFLGMSLYALLSALFDRLGTLIFSGILLCIGMSLFTSKIYLEYKREQKIKQKKQKQLPEPQTIILKKKSHFFDVFGKKDDMIIFPDTAFEDQQFEDDHDEVSPFMFDDPTPETKDISVEQPITIVSQPETKESEEKPEIIDVPDNSQHYENYQLPPLSLLSTKSTNFSSQEKNMANKNATRLTTVLKQFGVNATIENAFIGPTITKYELKLETGTRVNKILQLQDDIKLALATADIRIEAPIPGKPFVGIEVPNHAASMVAFKDVFKNLNQQSKLKKNKLVVALGKDVSGQPIFAELDKMPHLLIAGATGSGKSVCVNTIIASILMRARPDEVKLILVDPKKVELSIYNGIPHLLAPVVTDPKKAAAVLREVVSEMERRYDVFANVNARNIKGYNDFAKEYNESHEDQKEILPYHVIILDEVADLMMVASKEVEDCIMRISQMARAAGIHLIVATQRPSTDIITGVIKANIPSRIAFAVSSSIDSRTILDTSGAEKLLGKGDMLFSPMGSSSPIRIQGCFVSDDEVASLVHYVASQQDVQYEDKYVNVKATSSSHNDAFDDVDAEYEECREFVIQAQKASTSLLQRKFRIGYNKAARIIDQLEQDGVIGPQLGSKPREVYIRQYHEEDL